MLSDKNENKFLNALTDIDDDLIEEIMEIPVEPKIVSPAPKKTRFIRFAVPAAASLAIIAAVGIGALIIGSRLSSPLGGNTETTESEPASDTAQQSETQTESGAVTADTSPSQGGAEETTGLSSTPPINTGVSHPRPLSEVDIPNINGYSTNLDVPNDQILQSVILDTKKYGDYEVSLIGGGVFTDFENTSENTILAHKLDINLYKNGELIDFRSAYNPLDPDAPVITLYKDHLDCYLELIGNANEQKADTTGNFLIIFRSLNGTRPIPEVLFNFVYDGKLLDCERIDLGSNADRAERSEALSPDISDISMYIKGESKPEEYKVSDNLTGITYTFTPGGDRTDYMEGRSNFPWYKGGANPDFDPNSLPVIDDFTYDEAKEIRTKLSPPTVISKQTVGGYTLSLTGNNMRKTTGGSILFYNPKTVISKDGEYIGEFTAAFGEMTPYHAAIMYVNDGNYGHYAAEAVMMDDVLLIIDKGSVKTDGHYNYFGIGCFYAVKDGVLYSLEGNWPGMTNSSPPTWAEGHEGYDLIVDAENKTVIYGYMKFEFNFEALPAMFNYTVSWLQNPIE